MKTFKQLMEETPPKPTVAYVKRNNLHVGGWGQMKHHLVKIGVIPSTDQDAPKEWQEVFKKACGR